MYRRQQLTYNDNINRFYGFADDGAKSISLIVTEDCTLRCTYCYEKHKCKKFMSKEVAKKSIDMLFDEREKNDGYITEENSFGLIIDFIGGEPLLAIDVIDYTVDYFKEKAIKLRHPWAEHYMISMTTNGTLYFSDKVQEFIKKNKGKLSMTITVDGNKELHDACRVFPDGSGSYDIVEKAIKHQLMYDKYANTKLTIAPENVNYLYDAIKNLKNLGLYGVNGNCVYEEGWKHEHGKILYDQLKKVADYLLTDKLYKDFYFSMFSDSLYKTNTDIENGNWCGGTGKMLAIDTEGILYPCLRYAPFTLVNERPSMSIGDIYNGIEVTDRQKEIVTDLKAITRESQSTPECFNCPISTGCGWCSGYNYDLYGTANKRATFICVTHKARVLANVYFWNKLYQLEKSDDRFPNDVPREWALEIISEEEFDMLNELAQK